VVACLVGVAVWWEASRDEVEVLRNREKRAWHQSGQAGFCGWSATLFFHLATPVDCTSPSLDRIQAYSPFLRRVRILYDSGGSFGVHNHITHGYSTTTQEHRRQSFNFCAASGTISSRIRQLSDHYSYAYRNMLYCFCA
jgi:hypothetical protein